MGDFYEIMRYPQYADEVETNRRKYEEERRMKEERRIEREEDAIRKEYDGDPNNITTRDTLFGNPLNNPEKNKTSGTSWWKFFRNAGKRRKTNRRRKRKTNKRRKRKTNKR